MESDAVDATARELKLVGKELGDGLHSGVSQVVKNDGPNLVGATAEVAGIREGSESGGILHERLPELDRAEFRAVLERIPHRGLRNHQPFKLKTIGNPIAKAFLAVSDERLTMRRELIGQVGLIHCWSGEGGVGARIDDHDVGGDAERFSGRSAAKSGIAEATRGTHQGQQLGDASDFGECF